MPERPVGGSAPDAPAPAPAEAASAAAPMSAASPAAPASAPAASLAARVEAERWRLVLPSRPLAGRLGERLGQGTGSSLEFVDFRDYVPGDDLRHVDWRAYARTDQLKVRLFRDETSPSLDVVLDVSASMASTDAKREAARDLVDALDVWTAAHGGRMRLLAADGDVLQDVRRVAFDAADPPTFLPRAPLRPRTLRLLLSDVLRPDDPSPLLRRLAAGAAHLTVLQLLDPWELDPAPAGEATLVDVEGDGRLDVRLDAKACAGYRRRLDRLLEGVARATRETGGTWTRVAAAPLAEMCRRSLLPARVVEPA